MAALRDDPLQRNFERILAWCVISGSLAVAGGLAHGAGRPVLWASAVAVDLLGGLVGFYTPGLGRSTTADWKISVHHMSERCGAFVLIALGESIVLIGSTLAGLHHVPVAAVAAFAAAFAGVTGLWWVYFDRSADAAAEVVARSPDPGRLGRSAYHLIHPIMVAGIVVVAAADERVLADPSAPAGGATAWLVLGGTGLFLAGHAAFKATVWHRIPRLRLAAVAVLAALGALASSVSALALGAAATAVVLLLVVSDRLPVREAPIGA